MPHPEVVDLQNVRHFKDVITYLTSEFKIDIHFLALNIPFLLIL